MDHPKRPRRACLAAGRLPRMPRAHGADVQTIRPADGASAGRRWLAGGTDPVLRTPTPVRCADRNRSL